MKRFASRLIVCAGIGLFAASLAAPSAGATFPGRNGKISFVAIDNPFEIFTVNPDGSGLAGLPAPEPCGDIGTSFSPDGRQIVYASDLIGGDPNRSDVYVINSDGTGRHRLTHNPWQDREPVFAPDGTEIVFTSTRDRGLLSVWVMNADGTGARAISPSGAELPGWQPMSLCDGSGKHGRGRGRGRGKGPPPGRGWRRQRPNPPECGPSG